MKLKRKSTEFDKFQNTVAKRHRNFAFKQRNFMRYDSFRLKYGNYYRNKLATVLFLITIMTTATTARLCYSCAGTCHNEHHCNCQMGSCEADFCFIEKRPAPDQSGLYRITKGCMKRPSRTRLGCDYDHFASHIQCVCTGHFCNDVITLRRRHPMPIISASREAATSPLQAHPQKLRKQQHQKLQHHYYAQHHRPNVTCRACEERRGGGGAAADCDRTCRGEWCHEKASTGASGCGFGPPTLPYFYRGPELLWENGAKICVSLSRGNGSPQKYCICNTPMCNETPLPQQRVTLPPFPFSLFSGGRASDRSVTTSPPLNHRSRSILPEARKNDENSDESLKFYECVNCDITVEQSVFTSNCKMNRCYGHFCTYATQRVFMAAGPAASASAVGGGSAGASGVNTQAIIHERQGCMNVTDPRQVQLGCTHKWMNNEEEELYCACRGTNCNNDLPTAAASDAILLTASTAPFLIIFTVVTIFFTPTRVL